MPSPAATQYPIDQTLTRTLTLFSQRPAGVVTIFSSVDPDESLTLNAAEQAALLDLLGSEKSTDRWLDPTQPVGERIYAIHDREGLHLCCGPLRFHLDGNARDDLHDILHQHVHA